MVINWVVGLAVALFGFLGLLDFFDHERPWGSNNQKARDAMSVAFLVVLLCVGIGTLTAATIVGIILTGLLAIIAYVIIVAQSIVLAASWIWCHVVSPQR